MSLISPNFDVKSIIFSQFMPGAFSQNCWKRPWKHHSDVWLVWHKIRPHVFDTNWTVRGIFLSTLCKLSIEGWPITTNKMHHCPTHIINKHQWHQLSLKNNIIGACDGKFYPSSVYVIKGLHCLFFFLFFCFWGGRGEGGLIFFSDQCLYFQSVWKVLYRKTCLKRLLKNRQNKDKTKILMTNVSLIKLKINSGSWLENENQLISWNDLFVWTKQECSHWVLVQ